MKITHKLTKSVSGDIPKDATLFLCNNNGSYLALGAYPDQQISKYNGWFCFKPVSKDIYTLYKTVESIYLKGRDGRILIPEDVINEYNCVKRVYFEDHKKIVETFVNSKSGLIYEIEGEAYVNVQFDFRATFDSDDTGRIYGIAKETNDIVVDYKKYENNELRKISDRDFLIIHGVGDFSVDDRWYERNYSYESYRNSQSRFYVYGGIVFHAKDSRILFSYDPDKEKAHRKMHQLEHEGSNKFLVDALESKYDLLVVDHYVASKELIFSYLGAYSNFIGMYMNFMHDNRFNGLWAGLPWFFQHWSRDELISIGGLIAEKKYLLAKELLFKHLNYINADGRIANIYPHSGLGSADSIGWLFKRMYDLMMHLDENKALDEYFTLFELKYVHEKISYAIKKILMHNYAEGMISNAPLETWMDTSKDNDKREGFRIEIQTLFLASLKLNNYLEKILANRLVKKNDRLVALSHEHNLEFDMSKNVSEKFLGKVHMGDREYNILNDGFNCENSDVIRPNVFLAFYTYRDLLSDAVWEDVFDVAIKKLWCEWGNDRQGLPMGGLSTIDKSNKLFEQYYSGENNRSYHRGDSWFYINNIAAICMYKLNKEKYYDYIKAIINSSCEDILWNGYLGASSEISSAAVFRSAGCFCQTWSLATFIELVNEVFVK